MKTIVDNLATEYKERGTGESLLFLHGWGDDGQTFDKLIGDLQNNFHCLTLDLPGFGQTERPPSAWNVGSYAEFVRDFIIKKDLKPKAIVGHSFGGRIVIKGIASDILQAQKLILIGSAGFKKSDSFKNRLIKILAKVFGFIFLIPPFKSRQEKMRRKLYNILGSDYYEAGDLKETFIKVIGEDLTESAKEIKLPTLLIWGEDDRQTPLSDGLKLNSLIKNSELKVFKEAGHFVHQEKSSDVAEIINKFLS